MALQFESLKTTADGYEVDGEVVTPGHPLHSQVEAHILANDASAKAWHDAQTYLRETDWLILRQVETGKPAPPDVLGKRAAARSVLSGGPPE